MFRFVPLAFALISAAWAQSKASEIVGPLYTLSTIAGSRTQDQSQVFRPETLVFDTAGNLYIGGYNGKVYRVTPSGSMVVIAGPGVPGFGAGPVNGTIQLGFPLGVAADAAGSVYIADTANNRVLKLTQGGRVTTFVGATINPGFPGVAASSGDGGPASRAQVNLPFALAVDLRGNVYIGEYGGARVRKVTPDGIISTVAGTGQFGTAGDGGPATSAQIDVIGLAADLAGNLYIADRNSLVRKVSPDGTIRTVAGGGSALGPQDGVPATAAWLLHPTAVAVDHAGNLFIAEGWRAEIRKVTSDGIIHTVAGNGTGGYLLGPGRDALSSQLNYPSGIAFDAAGNLYIADFGNSVVRKVDTHGRISLYASPPIGDGGPASAASLPYPQTVALDSQGNIYLNDGSGRIRKIDANGIITTVAGTGEQGYVADGVAATSAPLNLPGQIAIGTAGDLFIADTGNHRIRKVDASGTITTVAGSGISGFSGDGGPAVLAQLSSPSAVAVDRAGDLYIADTDNHRIRKVSTGGTITTLAGNGAAGYSGDGGPASAAELASPVSVAVDLAGNVYTADSFPPAPAVRKISAGGVIATVAGTGQMGSSNDGVPAVSAALAHPVSIALDSDGDLFIADDRIRRVRPDGIIDTVAGWGQVYHVFSSQSGASADGVVPAFLEALTPRGIAVDTGGNLYIADLGSSQLRKASVLRPTSGPPILLPRSVVNAANLLPAPVAPGEVVILFGTDFGPAAGVSAQPDASGRFGTNLGGVRVLFDGVPAPVLYAQTYAVNAVVPFSVMPGATVEVRVEYKGQQSAAATIEIAEAAPAVFTFDPSSPRGGKAAALNQDGSINSPENPASVGSIVTLYATGAGAMQPAIRDGQIVVATDSKPVLPVSVIFVGGAPAEILYAGPAPGIVAGVLQLNVRVPDALCHGYWQCTLDPNAVPVYLGLGPVVSALPQYLSRSLVTVSVK